VLSSLPVALKYR